MDEIAAYYAAAAAGPPPPPGIPSSSSSLHQPPLHHLTYYHSSPPQGPHPHPPLVIIAPPQSDPRFPLAAHVQQSQLLHHHHHHHHHRPAPPLLSPYAQVLSLPPPPPPPSDDEVRTLFVAGLPEDVKSREIYHLFREFPGYVTSNIQRRSEHGQPFAFVVFMDQQSAVAAMHELNGMLFDLEKKSTLYIDLAKSNSRSKRSGTDDDHGSSKRFKAQPAFRRSSVDSGVGSFHIPGMGNSAHNTIGYPSTQSHLSYDTKVVRQTSTVKSSRRSSPPPQQDNPPCPTLFVAKLGPSCTERELSQVFSSCQGFLKLKMQNSRGVPVAFVDFQDTAASTEALGQLQGVILRSSADGEGMRLEYAKSRMGLRKK